MRKITIVLLLILTISSLSAVTPERIIFNEAESRYKNGDLDFALNRYEELMEEYPLSEYVPDAYFRKAVITLRFGKIEEAEILFERVGNRYKNTRFIDYLPFWKGLIKFKQENWEESSALFSIFLENNPSSLRKEAYLYQAKAEYTLGRIKSAVSILDIWLTLTEDIYSDPYIFTFYLTLLEKSGDYKLVLDLTEEIEPEFYEKSWMDRVNLIKAESLYKTGEIIESEIYYKKILSADPDIASIGFIRMFSIYKNDTDIQKDIFDKAQLQLSGHPVMLNKFLLRVGIDSYKNEHFELAASYLWRIWRTGKIDEINSLVPVYLAKILAREGDKNAAANILSSYNSKVSFVDELVLYTLSNVLVEAENWIDAESNLKKFLFTFPDSEYYSSAAWMYAYSLYKSEQYRESRSVIDSVLAEGKGSTYTNDFILLSARVYIKLGNFPYALAMFKEYLPFDDSNPEIWFDIIKLQFDQGQYNSVSDSFDNIRKRSLLDNSSPFLLLIQYIAGLGDIAEGKYKEGLEKLENLSGDILRSNDLVSIDPYVSYYRGWSSYKLADYNEAFKWFKLVVSKYPESNVYAESLYFAGWSAYLLGDYTLASEYFADFSNAASSEDKTKGLFFYSKSMYAENKLSEAELVFQNIYTKYPDDPYADDAMFEHGQILEKIQKSDLAISTYHELFNRYRTSPLAEESLFRIGEIYLSKGNYKKAQESFYYHRLKFPKGNLGDVSLYWGAESAEKMGESYGAILLLEKLLVEFTSSSFRPNALQKIASLYAEEGEYRKALIFYSDYLTSYSESDTASEVRSKIKKLNLLQSGSDEAEAGLLVLIGEKGIQTRESREAHISLAKMYLYKFNGREDEAFALLSIIAELRDKFPFTAAKAVYYLGDYYSINKEYVNAAKSFVDAASLYPEDRDLTGVSLLRAAEMAIAAGDIYTAKKMVNLLEINFPSTGWLEEGKKILEENR
ncbi:MAG: tetratricopeptide repeat protein [Spirochaetales bacterium]|nr:tetratricopeptide repeat protein [Spirochaetales bacterium]